MKIIVAPDSFKGTLSAFKAAQAMARGAQRAYPEALIVEMPIADGGEGTMDVLVAANRGRRPIYAVTGPLGKREAACIGYLGPDYRTAVVETAEAAGLGLIPKSKRNPRITTTYGVGQMLGFAVKAGATRIIVGLGGSATNDGGAGAMAALGARFLDASGAVLPPGGAALARLYRIDLSDFQFPFEQVPITVASDVQNPLIGPQGASFVYGPQKGADAAAVAELDAALTHYAQIIHRDLGIDIANTPGSGAAGGLGAALLAFLHAEFRPGIDVVLDAAGFDAQLRDTDLVLTGEGKIDSQTLNGKAISGLLARCRHAGVPLIAFGGTVDSAAAALLQSQGLTQAVGLVSGSITLAKAMRDPARVLEDAVATAILGSAR
jgi:glycerate kinase